MKVNKVICDICKKELDNLVKKIEEKRKK